MVKQYVRAMVNPDDVSDLEEGDKDLLNRSDMPSKDKILRYKGKMPREKKEDENGNPTDPKSSTHAKSRNTDA